VRDEPVTRIVKEHTVRRNEILDVAQRLVQTRGYEQMAIQDILDELRIAKGTFYHYFDSKQVLLEAVTERIVEQAVQVILPIVRDAHLPAIEKLQRVLDTVGRWKTARKPFFLELMRVWYADDNAIVRAKMEALGIQRVTPLFAEIIRQGSAEGTFTTDYPGQTGSIVMALIGQLSNTLARLLLAGEPLPDGLMGVKRIAAAYSDAVERVLGAPRHSLQIVDHDTIEEWFLTPGDTAHVDRVVESRATDMESARETEQDTM
jgi:AcrR family transcriptional regulator